MIIDLVNTSAFRFSSTLNSDTVEKSSYGNSLHGITLHYLKQNKTTTTKKHLIGHTKFWSESLPSSRPSAAWWRDCCRRTSPHHWSPGSAAPCHNCQPWSRTRPPTDGKYKWSSAERRSSAAWGRSSALRWWSFPPRRRSSAAEGIEESSQDE